MKITSQTVRTAFVAALLALGTLGFAQGNVRTDGPVQASEPDVRFILRTAQIDGRMGFIGAGGEIDRVINPKLTVDEGDTVEIVLLNGDGMDHYFVVEDLHVGAPAVRQVGDRTVVTFVADASGDFWYSCALASHWKSGMLGELVVQADDPDTL